METFVENAIKVFHNQIKPT